MKILSLDEYTLRARLAPAIIAGMPAFAFAAIFVSWGSLGLPQLLASVGVTILFAAFSDIARRRGRKIEPGLIEKMGGLASTTMLRHSDSTLDAATKARIHTFLAGKLAMSAPTEAQEKADPVAADDLYAMGGTWLRENTRDNKKFRVLFNENITYGFRRNLLGLRVPGFILNAVILAVCICTLAYRSPTDLSSSFNGALLAVIVASIIHASYLAFFVNDQSVFDAARIYARQLLMSADSQFLNKPAAATRATPSRSKKKTP